MTSGDTKTPCLNEFIFLYLKQFLHQENNVTKKSLVENITLHFILQWLSKLVESINIMLYNNAIGAGNLYNPAIFSRPDKYNNMFEITIIS